VMRKVGGGALDPDVGELDMTAGWGHAGARGVCMPGQGKVEERGTKDEKQSGLPGQGQRTLNPLRRKDLHQELVAPAGDLALPFDAVL
jgi:hypothetical protein